jgi:hypothetical protein
VEEPWRFVTFGGTSQALGCGKLCAPGLIYTGAATAPFLEQFPLSSTS